jgi:GT2 family glycosyltransferase
MRQPRVRHNDYTVLEVPRLGEWEPRLGVSVVIPAYSNQDKLDLALASLAAQSYPNRLLEVVVVDDGSSPPIRLPELAPANTRLVQSPSDGWGSAHAVTAGVGAASHDVILRLDADMVAYREHVEAHMRWHHLADYLTVMGSVTFAEDDAAGPAPVDVLDAIANGKAAELFDLEKARPSWVERVYEATDNLLRAGNRAFQVAAGATISFSRRLYDESGGLDTAMALGSETEFGYRLAQVGAVFVPDRDARSWHLGLSQMESRSEEERRFRAPFIGQRVPLLDDNRRAHQWQWSIPHVDVVVDAADRSFEELGRTVLSALTGSFIDVGVTIVGPWGELNDERRSVLDDPLVDLRLVREAFAGDGRVRFMESVPATSFPAPFRFRCPVGLVLTRDGLRRLIEETDQRLDGLVLLPVLRDRMLPSRGWNGPSWPGRTRPRTTMRTLRTSSTNSSVSGGSAAVIGRSHSPATRPAGDHAGPIRRGRKVEANRLYAKGRPREGQAGRRGLEESGTGPAGEPAEAGRHAPYRHCAAGRRVGVDGLACDTGRLGVRRHRVSVATVRMWRNRRMGSWGRPAPPAGLAYWAPRCLPIVAGGAAGHAGARAMGHGQLRGFFLGVARRRCASDVVAQRGGRAARGWTARL